MVKISSKAFIIFTLVITLNCARNGDTTIYSKCGGKLHNVDKKTISPRLAVILIRAIRTHEARCRQGSVCMS